jgi:hypothetical protein
MNPVIFNLYLGKRTGGDARAHIWQAEIIFHE